MIDLILHYGKYIIPATLALWVFWVVITQVAEKYGKDSKNPIVKALYVLFLVADVAFNFVYGSIWFLEPFSYRRLTLTSRLKFILLSGDFKETEWRFKLALFMCRKMISPWDWNHCGMGYGKK